MSQNLLYVVAELHLDFHGGSSNGLTQVTCHNNKSLMLKLDISCPNIGLIMMHTIFTIV